MTKKMLIDAAQNEEIRVALVDGKKVEDFDFESSSRKPLRGNIYLARVTRVEPSLQAAFVEYGGNRHGFLAFSEIHPDYYQIPVSDRQLLQAAEQEMADIADELERHQRGDDEDHEDDEIDDASGNLNSDDEDNSDEDDAPVAANDAEDQDPVDLLNQDGDAQDGDAQDGDADAEATSESSDEAETLPLGSLDEADDIEEIVIPVLDTEIEASEDTDETPDAGSIIVALNADGEPQISTAAEASDDDTDLDDDYTNDGSTVEQRKRIAELNEQYKEARRKHARLIRNYKIQEVVKARQILLVQVVKEERGTKGAALTSYMSLAGRYCVLMPNTARGGGISRKIPSATDRKRLRRIVNDLDVTKGMGLIIRTAGAKRTKTEIKRDYDYLLRLWENIRELTLKSVAPCLIYEEASLIKRAIRDLYDKDITRVLVEGEEGYREAKDFMKMLMPSHAKYVQPYKEETPLFLHFDVEQQLDAMYQPAVRLKSGGYLVIHQTEALIAVDVNSGKATRERNIESTALKTNLEAASEVARQCKLRDLAGLIVIDFIDMEEGRNNRAVEKRLKESLKNDRARIQTGRISSFGLLEMSRQRRRSGIVDGTTSACPTCSGSGAVRSHEMASLRILRAIEAEAISNRAAIIAAKTSMEVALYILNHKRAWLTRIETHYALTIEITADPSKAGDLYEIERRGAARALPDRPAAIQADYGVDDDADEVISDHDDEDKRDQRRARHTDEDADDGEGRKRRKRRRRRRGGRDGDDNEENTTHANEERSEESSNEGDESQDSSPQARSEDDSDEDKPKKRRRRGRRGGRRNREQENRGEDERPQTNAASEPTENNVQAEGENTPPPEVTTEQAISSERAEQAAQPNEESATSDSAAVEKPKRKRRSRAKPKEDAASPEANVEASSDGAVQEAPVKKPARKSTRKTAAARDDKAADSAPASAEAPDTSAPVASATKKPTKKGWWQRALGA